MDSGPALTAAKTDGRLGPTLLGIEAVLTVVEIGVIAGPVVFASGQAGQVSGRIVAVLAAALWLAGLMRMLDAFRPVRAVVSAKRRQQPVLPEAADEARRAFVRAPSECGLLRFVSWGAVLAVALGFGVARRGLAPGLACGLAAVGLVHAAALAALRTLLLERVLARVRPLVLPSADGVRDYMAAFGARTVRLVLVSLGLVTASFLAVAGATTPLAPVSLVALPSVALPALLVAAALSYGSFLRRRQPIDAYLAALLQPTGGRALSRDEPTAVPAFLAAQGLPYRIALHQGLGIALSLVAAVAVGRRGFGWPAEVAAALLTNAAVLVAMGALLTILLHRLALRPFLRHLGSRHHLPLGRIRSPVGLRAKLVGAMATIGCGAAGFVGLGLRAGGAGVLSSGTVLLVGAIWVVGAILLTTRDLANPLVTLDGRSEEMARGELARPVPPAGEADEIGRLTFAFEEMRRALRDRLRSTESINVDLEREVRRRTDALEQRNAELRDAMGKLEKAKDDLVRSEKMASMGRLVAGIAHEINNPVNAVINSLAPLQESLRDLARTTDAAAASALGAEAERMLGVIQRGADRTKAIVRALHNYSRGDDATFTEVDLGRSVDDTLDLLRHRLRDVRVTRAIDPAARVWGLPGPLGQVLMNLITNAAQALGDGGGTISVEAITAGDVVRLVIADDGPGIPADVLPKIFDPFFTTKAVGEGSGLGLSIVHGIVERHGGRIDVQSEPGRGTRFVIDLPRGPSVPSTAKARTAERIA